MRSKGYVASLIIMGLIASILTIGAVVIASPESIGPAGVTLWFLVLMVALTSWISIMVYLLQNRLGLKTSQGGGHLDASRRGLMLAGFTVTLLALSSLKQLNLRDALLLVLLLVLVEFYTVARA